MRPCGSVEQTERVVYPNTVACEVIAVVKLTEFVAYSIIVGAGGIGQFMQGVLEISVYFLFRDATDVDITAVHRYVIKVVQVAEHAHLAKFCHTGEKCEAYVSVERFQYRVECFEYIPVFVLKHLVADGLQHWFVVLVHEYHHGLVCSSSARSLNSSP